MHCSLQPELSLPLYQGVADPADVRAAALAMFSSAEYLTAFGGGQSEITPAARVNARAVMSEAVEPEEVQDSSTARHLKVLVDEYDKQVIQSAVQIRTYVTNRLLEEAAPGNKGAIRALELLGKISGVDLFTERSEITIKTQPTEELVAKVREKLARLSARTEDATDVPFIEAGAPMKAEVVHEPMDDPFEAARGVLNALTHRD